ncbi:MAG: hypothetical protein A2075_04245 [Geobacteraceae bacterium GWC2_58_44]|nr:MAG: hypothetical protein A2075_04245 [Geobacteraceae bacterium GWC2_58_44]
MVLFRLLSGLARERYCLISSGRKPGNEESAASERLDADLFHLPKVRQLPAVGWPIFSALFICINTLWVVFRRSRQIEAIARREGCQSLIACTGDFYDLPATFIACRRLGIAFVPYIFDDYAYQWLGFRRRIAKLMEPLLLRRAAAVIVPNEYLQKEYRERHDIDSVVIHNPCPLPDLDQLDRGASLLGDGVNIVYTGAIYHAHYDAFVNLIAALNSLGRKELRLHLFTAQSERELAEHGVAGPRVVHHPHVPQSEVNRILRQADILFLPLAFSSPIPEVIRTSAPGKTGEYLAVGRPVLVHALPDSFISWYFRENRCGMVVDQPDAKVLSAAVEALVSSGGLQAELGLRAREKARTDFEISAVRSKFYILLDRLADYEHSA